MPKRNWTWAAVKEGNTTVGRVNYSSSDRTKYRAFKTEANAPRDATTKFGHRQVNHAGGSIKKAYASAKLRQRPTNSARAALAAIAVLNPGYNPVPANKSHLIPDKFGAPNMTQNLSNERESINLSGHKLIENRIGRLMTAASGGNTHHATIRGGIVVRETFDAAGQPKGRQYMVSIKNRTTGNRTFHKLTFNRS
ncbi:hypothetical protein [Dyella koreensis]|uniref:Uncharacterized protein n=1 Tax=Dyella koreensis TaxID=311235 RepID=A0ABW8KA66_9GAMM